MSEIKEQTHAWYGGTLVFVKSILDGVATCSMPNCDVPDSFEVATGSLTAYEFCKNSVKSKADVLKTILEQLLNESEEIISTTGLRFNGVHDEKIKQVFQKYNIKLEPKF